MRKNFHELALESILFKGRSDWYFCFLKAEKIAHVLSVLAQKNSSQTVEMEDLIRAASNLPHAIAHFAAGEMEPALVLADIFSLLSSVRLSGTRGFINPDNTLVLVEEYENIAEKIAAENRLSPFLTSQDLSVPEISAQDATSSLLLSSTSNFSHESDKRTLKDIKGQTKQIYKGQAPSSLARANAIFDFVRKNPGVSIKEIASVVRDCSEKTIQRELTNLIKQGLVSREGERRWSTYKAVS